jgi:hypothetical protein
MRTAMNKNDRRQVRAWMIMEEIRQTDVQVALKQKSINQVHSTLQGFRNDRRVLQYLIDRGCPVEYLNLPVDMRKAA